jgi:hypothetical protein
LTAIVAPLPAAGDLWGAEALIGAVVAGDRESWIGRHFGDGYPRDLPNGAVFHDFVIGLLREFLDDVYECEACGRLWVQRPGTDNEFAPFLPESDKVERVLRSPRDTRPAESKFTKEAAEE